MKRESMTAFTYIWYIWNIISLAVGGVYSVYGNVFPERVIAGSSVYRIGGFISVIAFAGTGLITYLYYYMDIKTFNRITEYFDKVTHFSSLQTVIIVAVVLYGIYRTFFFGSTVANNANGIMGLLSLALVSNVAFLVISGNLLKVIG